MDKLFTTNTGGFPLKSDDLRFMDASYRDAFKALLKGLLGSYANGVIIGCRVEDDGPVVYVHEGYIAYQDEIWYVPDHTVTIVSGQTMYFYPELTWDAAGSKIFQSTDVYDTYQVRRMKLNFSASPPGDAMLYDNILFDSDDESSLSHVIMHNLQTWFLLKMPAAWIAVTLLNSWSNSSNVTDYPALKFRKDIGDNHVEIRGWVKTDEATSDHVFTLPVGSRPGWMVDMPIHQGTTQCRLMINSTDGHVTLVGYSAGAAEICINVRFPLT